MPGSAGKKSSARSVATGRPPLAAPRSSPACTRQSPVQPAARRKSASAIAAPKSLAPREPKRGRRALRRPRVKRKDSNRASPAFSRLPWPPLDKAPFAAWALVLYLRDVRLRTLCPWAKSSNRFRISFASNFGLTQIQAPATNSRRSGQNAQGFFAFVLKNTLDFLMICHTRRWKRKHARRAPRGGHDGPDPRARVQDDSQGQGRLGL